MKMNAFVLALGMFALAASYADTLVTSCQVGSGKTIQLIKGKEITQDVGVYYLVQNGKQKPLFGSLSTSTGSVISSRCIGTTRGVLMVAGEFSSNYTQGVVVGYDQGANRIQRLDFAERALPRWVYLNKTSIKVLIPNEGNEQPGK